jgi:hypothetical protein
VLKASIDSVVCWFICTERVSVAERLRARESDESRELDMLFSLDSTAVLDGTGRIEEEIPRDVDTEGLCDTVTVGRFV